MAEDEPHFPAPRARTVPTSAGPFREPSPRPASELDRLERRSNASPRPLPSKPSRTAEQDALPTELAGPHFRERLGFIGVAFAISALLALMGISYDRETTSEPWRLAAVVGVIALGTLYEIVVRRRRLALVPCGVDRVGVYRRGQLVVLAKKEDFGPPGVRFMMLTARRVILFGVLSLVGMGMLALVLFGSQLRGRETMLIAAAAIGGTLALVSTVWSRIVCVQYILRSGRIQTEVALRRADAAELFSPNPIARRDEARALVRGAE